MLVSCVGVSLGWSGLALASAFVDLVLEPQRTASTLRKELVHEGEQLFVAQRSDTPPLDSALVRLLFLSSLPEAVRIGAWLDALGGVRAFTTNITGVDPTIGFVDQ